ncbi:MAG: DinB family protein [Gemmatimonadetes bacterium]|nr:DinB family protein [Gemmatimonadota bacterium]
MTIWGGEVVIGFNPKELSRLFGLNGDVAVADLSTMIEKYETVLEAACRATRQLPPDHMDWECPERKRTLGRFTFHIFDRPERALNAYNVGMYSSEDRGRNFKDVLGSVGFEEIARYGEEVLSRVKSALAGPSPLDLDKVLDTYMGSKTASELMDLALGHSVHHLKQLYEYMSLIGIEPNSPLVAADFEGIAVVGERFYLVTSSGRIYESREGADGLRERRSSGSSARAGDGIPY